MGRGSIRRPERYLLFFFAIKRNYRELDALTRACSTSFLKAGGTLSDQPGNLLTILPLSLTTKNCGTVFIFISQWSMASCDSHPNLKFIFDPPATPPTHSTSVVERGIVRPTTSTPRLLNSLLISLSSLTTELQTGHHDANRAKTTTFPL